MSGDIAISLFFIGVIAFSIVLAIAANRKTTKNKVSEEAKIVAEKKEEVLGREQAVPIKSQAEAQAEAEARAREKRARARAAIQSRIEALTKEQNERKAIAEKMTIRLDVPSAEAKPRQLLINKYAGLIEQFYEIAERKVSLRDEYGDENWGVLDKEICKVIRKITEREGIYKESIWRKSNLDTDGMPDLRKLPEEYFLLPDFLKKSFREYYKERRSHPIKQPDFATMSGLDFEAYVMDILDRQGYTVRGTPITGDQGADILAKKDGKKIVIQTKNYRSTVGNEAVQQVAAAVRFYDCNEGWVVTNSTFTQAAIELAQRNDIQLIDHYKLARMIK